MPNTDPTASAGRLSIVAGNVTFANNIVEVGNVNAGAAPGFVFLNSTFVSTIAFTGNEIKSIGSGHPIDENVDGVLVQGVGNYNFTQNRFAVSGGPSQASSAVHISGGTTVSFNGNFIEGTIGGGLSATGAFGDLTIDYTGEGTLTVTCNWHDASGVAGLNASVSEGVEITSTLLTNGDDPAQTGFQPTGNCATIGGCNISTACNYDATATISDGSCTYPPAGYDDCA